MGNRMRLCILPALLLFMACLPHDAPAQTAHPSPSEPKQLVIIDTDIGDDIDDAFALGLALQSPEFRILGITTAFGDTAMREQLVMKFLAATGFANVPVAAGVPTQPKTTFTQMLYTSGGQLISAEKLSGPDFILDQIRKHPGEITLIAIGPQTNLGAAIDKDPATFRKLKRIVMMGGSVYKGYKGGAPDPEWNILCDIPAAQKVFTSGVPLYVMPLDSTILRLDTGDRNALFEDHTPITDQIHILYDEWSAATKQKCRLSSIRWRWDTRPIRSSVPRRRCISPSTTKAIRGLGRAHRMRRCVSRRMWAPSIPLC